MMTQEQYLLGKLAEEALEVAKEALKGQQFGLDEINPESNHSNREDTHKELDDLLAIIEMLCELGFDYIPSEERVAAKKIKVLKFLEKSISLGKVQPSN